MSTRPDEAGIGISSSSRTGVRALLLAAGVLGDPLLHGDLRVRGVLLAERADLVGQLKADPVRVEKVDRLPDALVVGHSDDVDARVIQPLFVRKQLLHRVHVHREVAREPGRVAVERAVEAFDLEERDRDAVAHRVERVQEPDVLAGGRDAVLADGADQLAAENLRVKLVSGGGARGSGTRCDWRSWAWSRAWTDSCQRRRRGAWRGGPPSDRTTLSREGRDDLYRWYTAGRPRRSGRLA
jgi:hypothetical protein